MTTALRPSQAYLAAVAAALADLPAEDRGDLLEDLAAHLAAVEQEDGDVPLVVRLGPPERYAAELRASAGLPPVQDGRARRSGRLRAQLAEDRRRLRQSTAGREVAAFLPLLVPGWWILRAYLLVFVLALMSGAGLRGAVLLDVGLPPVGWALLAAAVVGSVRLGRRRLAQPKRQLLLVAEVALAALASTVLLDGAQGGVQTVYVQDSAPLSADGQWPLLSTAGPVTDIHPYAADGTPLDGVLLFDQDGRPLRVGQQQWWADGCRRVPRPPLATDGVPVPFSYPQRYVIDESDPYGVPGQCRRDVPRPPVPLPDMPVQTQTGPPAPRRRGRPSADAGAGAGAGAGPTDSCRRAPGPAHRLTGPEGARRPRQTCRPHSLLACPAHRPARGS
jgi:uncharacterized membrane protein